MTRAKKQNTTRGLKNKFGGAVGVPSLARTPARKNAWKIENRGAEEWNKKKKKDYELRENNNDNNNHNHNDNNNAS